MLHLDSTKRQAQSLKLAGRECGSTYRDRASCEPGLMALEQMLAGGLAETSARVALKNIFTGPQEYTLRIGPPRGGHDRRHLASAKGILSDPKSNTVLMRSPNVFGIFSLQILRFYWKSTILSNFRGLQYMIFRKIRCFWTVTYVSFRFSVFFTF